ncbi:MAG: hypothetical protein RL525_366 [Bacteroidota bacterium]|jgi:hypothetical protein
MCKKNHLFYVFCRFYVSIISKKSHQKPTIAFFHTAARTKIKNLTFI